mmetsp:Transcript_47713/g.120108  ORF Transcript_47713/g.120108 Transcript_47713/m.120108 type:complete len:95 (-) Transcript_47713:496-780(-)
MLSCLGQHRKRTLLLFEDGIAGSLRIRIAGYFEGYVCSKYTCSVEIEASVHCQQTASGSQRSQSTPGGPRDQKQTLEQPSSKIHKRKFRQHSFQ